MATFIDLAAFGGGVSIADEQHQAVVVQEILGVITRMKPIYLIFRYKTQSFRFGM